MFATEVTFTRKNLSIYENIESNKKKKYILPLPLF